MVPTGCARACPAPRHGDGFANNKQAYPPGADGDCGRRYVPEGAYRRPGPAVKEQGIAMYTEGSSLSAVGSASGGLGYSAAAVQGWAEKGGTKR